MKHRSARLVLLFALLALALAFSLWMRRHSSASRLAKETNADPEVVARFLALEAREREIEQSVFAKELLAQQSARVFESFWDSLNAATNKLRVLASFPVGEVIVPSFNPPERIGQGMDVRSPSGQGQKWSDVEWKGFLETSEKAGWEMANLEFRHVRFDTDPHGQPKESQFYFRANLVNETRPGRATFDGDIVVKWAGAESAPRVAQIDATRLTLRTRLGDPPFVPVLNETIAPPEKSHFIDPLVLYDLDADGRSEIILVARNVVYRQKPGGGFEAGPLCRHGVGLLFTGVIADFDGDGPADLAAAGFEGVFIFKGSPQGTFDQPKRLAWSVNPHFRYAQAITCGDVDHDGDLDLFIGQYKVPYAGGQMPTPYYNANDGDPAYLLLNDGRGKFTDGTDAAGLGKKRWRRSYSASFADLNGDGHLDLVVVSDFAGVDVYRNDGRGHFADVTPEWFPEPHAFGMAHALTDFNNDGRLDFLMIGMNSPTADRLNHLDLWRPGVTEDRSMRARMTYGNRLYVARPLTPSLSPSGGEGVRRTGLRRAEAASSAQAGEGESGFAFEQTALSDFVARSGWSWGCAASDFDNDGFVDLYIANGHETRRSVNDYESEFWLHDIYAANSTNDLAANVYFQSRFNNRVGRGQSYGGYEKNRLYLNRQGAAFNEVGHLLGVGLEEDSRGVVADDLDGDGKMDLILTTFEAWPQIRQTLRVYRNTLNDTGNWIGFRFREEGGGGSPVGATITIRPANGIAARQIVTGDSYRSQQANTVHFGLGNSLQINSAELQWSDGRKVNLQNPARNQYHLISPPSKQP
jgi:hypothetical protein